MTNPSSRMANSFRGIRIAAHLFYLEQEQMHHGKWCIFVVSLLLCYNVLTLVKNHTLLEETL